MFLLFYVGNYYCKYKTLIKLMNYTLNQLQIFLTVARAQSVTKAAEELNLTQPAVSIQLKNFQDQFELPLTEVVGRKILYYRFWNRDSSVG